MLLIIPLTAHESLRVNFAEKANVIGPWIEQKIEAVMDTTTALQGSLEDHLERLKLFEHDTSQYKPNLEDLEALNQAVQEAMIFENPHTQYTMEVRHRVAYVKALRVMNR